MNNWKDLYENEKRQRLQTETTMKEIVNGLCLSAFTISEDSKMQLLKSELQRLQQEIVRLESSKQQRLQQHLMSVGGMIQQMAGGNMPKVPSQTIISPMSNSVANRSLSMGQAGFVSNNQQSAFSNYQRSNGLTTSDRLNASMQMGNLKAQQDNGVKFQKPRATTRAPRKKKSSSIADEVIRPNSAVPMPNVLQAMKNPMCRPMSAVPPSGNFDKTQKGEAVEHSSDSMLVDKGDSKTDLVDQNNNNKSQAEDEIVVTGTVQNVLTGSEKSEFFCDFCETATANEEETVFHLWKHVNEIKRMYAFECVLTDCNYKSNVTKEALAHKKNHAPEDNCKILDRRDSLNEYFKHCVNKYFVRLDDATKEKIYDSRHS